VTLPEVGDLALVAIEDDIVRVALTGACSHCGAAGQTLGALRRHIAQATGLPLRVLPASDH
jgi:Fe-S cluster biogenesis protein NfuA